MAADHLFELDADLLAQASELEGHPDNVAAALHGGFVVCADGAATRFDPPTGLEALARRAARGGPHGAGAGGHAVRGPASADAVFNVAHGALLVARAGPRRLGPVARGLADRLHQHRRAHLFPRSMELVRRAPALGALGATISGAGPTVLVWCRFEQTAAVVEALRREADGWARVLRAPFEPHGADVREL